MPLKDYVHVVIKRNTLWTLCNGTIFGPYMQNHSRDPPNEKFLRVSTCSKLRGVPFSIAGCRPDMGKWAALVSAAHSARFPISGRHSRTVLHPLFLLMIRKIIDLNEEEDERLFFVFVSASEASAQQRIGQLPVPFKLTYSHLHSPMHRRSKGMPPRYFDSIIATKWCTLEEPLKSFT